MTWGTFNKKDSLAEAIAKKLSGVTEGTVQTKKYSWGTMKHVEHGHSFSIPLHPEHHQAIHKLKDGESHSFTDETKSKWKATREGDKVHFHGASRGNDGYKTTVKHDDLKESVEQMDEEYKVYTNAHDHPDYHEKHKDLDSAKKALAKYKGGALYHKGKLYNKQTNKFEDVEQVGEPLTEAAVSTVAKAHGFVKGTGMNKGSFVHPKTGETITALSHGSEFGHSRKDGSTVAAFKHKDSLEKHLASHGYKKTNEGFSEEELDTLINEVLTADHPAGKWIEDFVNSDNPKFAGKSKEKRKQMALAAYYAAQKKESTDYESFLVLDEASQGDIVKMGAKEIKHANMKDKQDEAEVMEPHSEGEADFLDKHSVRVTDDPTQSKLDAGKVPSATKPTGQGAGKYDANSKLSDKDKASYKEEVSTEDSFEDTIVEAAGCSCEKAGKKTFRDFKKEVK